MQKPTYIDMYSYMSLHTPTYIGMYRLHVSLLAYNYDPIPITFQAVYFASRNLQCFVF